jgi:ribosomal protein L29
MKTTDKQTLHTKSTVELQKLVEEAYNTLGQLKLDNVQNKLKNNRSIFHTRKEIAVMQTILQMKLKTNPSEEVSVEPKGGKK